MAVDRKVAKPASINLVDTHFLFRIADHLKSAGPEGRPLTVNYRELQRALGEARKQYGLRAVEESFAPAAIDLKSEAQQRFVEALQKVPLIVDALDFRTTFVSNPFSDTTASAVRPVASLAPYLSYVMGLAADRADPQIVVVTGSFDVFLPMLDLARRGTAVLAFFRRFLDPRWTDPEIGRLFDRESTIKFFDLEAGAEAILGTTLKASANPVAGLSRI